MKKILILLAFVLTVPVLKAQVLKMPLGREFKIVQFTDVHFVPNDQRSDAALKVIGETIESEKPDLVVLTGDIVTGKPAAEGWKTVLSLIQSKSVPFAVTLGNHDHEQDLTREEVARVVKGYSGCLNNLQVKGVDGYLNTALEIKSSDSKRNAFVIYTMDSNDYSTIDTVKGYGWFRPNQIAWYNTQSARFKARNGGKPVTSLAFFHIALPEYVTAYKAEGTKRAGVRLEDECPPDLNTGMFSNMLFNGDVVGTFVGHDHDIDYVVDHYGIALAYGRFTGGKTTYIDIPNGARIITLKEGNHGFSTYVRLVDGSIIDKFEY